MGLVWSWVGLEMESVLSSWLVVVETVVVAAVGAASGTGSGSVS